MAGKTAEGVEPQSPHSKIVIQLGDDAHRLLKIEAARNMRTVRLQAAFYIMQGLKDVKP